jgi:Nif-specific regulatory protein
VNKNSIEHVSQDRRSSFAEDERLLLQQMTKLGSFAINEDQAISEVLHLMSELIGLNRGRVLQIDRETEKINEKLRITHAYGLTKEQVAKGIFNLGEGVTGAAFSSGRVVIVQDIDDEPMYLARTVERLDLPQEVVSYIALPFEIQGKTAGVLAAHRLRNRTRALADDVELMRMVATWIAQFLTVNRLVAERTNALLTENTNLRQKLGEQKAKSAIIGSSALLQSALQQVEHVANSDATVLLLGESGTGKELFAHALHSGSDRLNAPFIKVNCGAIPESLFESELFGHEKGAFTGALTKRIGRIEQAHQGTLFLDEIGDMPLAMQVKLLRVLQDRVVERLGGGAEIPVNIRVIAATHRDLPSLISQSLFRLDLYYRLSVIPIRLPALRERSEDIPTIAWHLLANLNLRYGKKSELSRAAMASLCTYEWPGNVRQLRNTLERLVLLGENPTPKAPIITEIEVEDLMRTTIVIPPMSVERDLAAQQIEVRTTLFNHSESSLQNILDAIFKAGGNKSRAAQSLGLTLRQLNYRLEKLTAASSHLRI